jgi:hypothetical protein
MDPRYTFSIARLSEGNSVLVMSEPRLEGVQDWNRVLNRAALRFGTAASYFTSHTRYVFAAAGFGTCRTPTAPGLMTSSPVIVRRAS